MRCDSDLQGAVEAELSCHPDVDDTEIVVSVRDGIVTLTGYARNLFQKYGAEDAVKRVAGVTAVANDINLQRGVLQSSTDPEIARDVVAALKRVLPLCWERIRPVVRQRAVTLEGTVNCHYQREVAEDAARRLKDVVSVVNAITLAHSADAVAPGETRRRIEEALRRSARLDASALTVEARGSDVTLRGRVRAWSEHREAEECAWSAPGVRHVHNQLIVTAAGRPIQPIRIHPNSQS
jgi:osmotically-inducible protein OsmY